MSGPWSGSVYGAHTAFQELQAIALVLCRIAFWLSGNVVVLQWDNSTAEVYLCNQGSTVAFFSFQTCLLHIESGWQAWYHSNTSIHSYLSQCGSQLSFMGQVGPRVASSSSHSPSSFTALGSTRGGSSGFLTYQSLSILLHSRMTNTSRSFGVECIQPFCGSFR